MWVINGKRRLVQMSQGDSFLVCEGIEVISLPLLSIWNPRLSDWDDANSPFAELRWFSPFHMSVPHDASSLNHEAIQEWVRPVAERLKIIEMKPVKSSIFLVFFFRARKSCKQHVNLWPSPTRTCEYLKDDYGFIHLSGRRTLDQRKKLIVSFGQARIEQKPFGDSLPVDGGIL
jgi:hypothetical protein